MNSTDILQYALKQIKGRKQSKTGKSKNPQLKLEEEANILFAHNNENGIESEET